MSVHISKKAELFYKALEDVWAAEQLWRGSPNNAVWHCTQAAEKTLKGFLRCLNREYDYGHELKDLLDAADELIELTPETITYILYLNRFGVGLRYKNMSSDPSIDEANVAIARTKQIIQEFGSHSDVSSYMKEAEEVHSKVLKVNLGGPYRNLLLTKLDRKGE